MYEKYVKKPLQHYFAHSHSFSHFESHMYRQLKNNIYIYPCWRTHIFCNMFSFLILPCRWPYIIGCWLPDIVNTIIVIFQTTKHNVVCVFFVSVSSTFGSIHELILLIYTNTRCKSSCSCRRKVLERERIVIYISFKLLP